MLFRSMGGNSAITMGTNPVATVTSVISDPNRIHQTLPYGRIATHAQRDARIAAEQITTSQSPMVMATIMEYLDNGLNQEQGDYLDYIQRQRQLQNGFNGTLAGIAEQKQKLADVRKGLASLAATPDDITQLKMLYAFGVGVRNQLSNTNSLPPKKQ